MTCAPIMRLSQVQTFKEIYMFYRPEEGHGLPHNPFNALITPRPIAWVSTRGPSGDNLAPFSFFAPAAYVPPQLSFCSTGTKDTLVNIRESGVFAVNMVGEADLQAMSASSAALSAEIDEFDLSGTEKSPCLTIDCPRVAQAVATLECRLIQIVPLKGRDNLMVLGEVTGIHMRDDCLVNGRFSPERFAPLARMGYRDYTIVRDTFEHLRPGEG